MQMVEPLVLTWSDINLPHSMIFSKRKQYQHQQHEQQQCIFTDACAVNPFIFSKNKKKKHVFYGFHTF